MANATLGVVQVSTACVCRGCVLNLSLNLGNIPLGLQERRAGEALDALNATFAPNAQVTRDGKDIEVPRCASVSLSLHWLRSRLVHCFARSAQLVPGDIVRLNLGDQIPADLRLFESQGIAALEAALTGYALLV